MYLYTINLKKMTAVNDPCELSIIIPCLNEHETLETCIQKAQSFLNIHQVAGEVVVADNGSTDGSAEIALRTGARVVQVKTRGYGAALMGGITVASGRYVIMGDADDSYDFNNLLPFLEMLRQGYELVVGNRFKGGIKPGAMPFLHQYLGNPVLSLLGRLFFRSPVGDFHCGLRGFHREAILNLDLRTTGMEFASEMVVKATLHRMQIGEVPTVYYPDGRSRPSHLRTWSDGWRHLRFMLLYSPRWLFLYPGIVMLLLGGLVSLWLLPGPRRVGNVVFDVNTLLFANLVVLIGFQAILFALFTKVFSISEGLLPEDQGFTRIFRYARLETGLVAGLLAILIGLISSFAALLYWRARSFGEINPSASLRLVIPGVVLVALGFQITLSSFFLSILGLKRR